MTNQLLNQVLFSSDLVSIGLFDCPVGSPQFRNTGPINGYLIAFPRTAIKIRHVEMKQSFVADPNVVTIYNKDQEYERYQLSPYGDRCDWLMISPELVRRTIKEFGNRVLGEPKQLFQVSYAACSAKNYLSFRRLIGYLTQIEHPDRLLVEEQAITLFVDLIKSAHRHVPYKNSRRKSTSTRHVNLIKNVRELLAVQYKETISIEEIAAECSTSIYHLCRVYRRVAGVTIHQTISQLRLRDALQVLAESNQNLTDLGIDLGYSDHSHFSLYFRRSFGISPSTFRHRYQVSSLR